MELLIGCDPEVFVRKVGSKRFHVSAHGLNEGTKERPLVVDNGAIQVDGMALEFNINPARTEDEFVYNVQSVLKHLETTLPKGHELSIKPTAHFTKKTFLETPDEAKALGCTPDYNAWTGLENVKPNADVSFRTASGHIHIGWTQGVNPFHPQHLRVCRLLVMALDCTLGAASTVYDKDVKRRSMYGAAGAFRPKPYGVEYRVLSNAWLESEERMRYVYDSVVKTFFKLMRGDLVPPTRYKSLVENLLGKKPPQASLKRLQDIFPTFNWEGAYDL